jgi:hypothetical protein
MTNAALVRALHGWHAGPQVAQSRGVGILRFVVGERLLFSQMAAAVLAIVPLWKVIAGPRAGKTKAGPARVRFSFIGNLFAARAQDARSCR